MRFELLNLGIGGYNTLGELGVLLSVGLALDPDSILLLIVTNDGTIQLSNQAFYTLFSSSRDEVIETQLRRQTYVRDTIVDPLWRAANAVIPYLARHVAPILERLNVQVDHVMKLFRCISQGVVRGCMLGVPNRTATMTYGARTAG